MAMMDSFFVKGFKASKCKTLLKLTIPRIKLLRNRREIQIKQMRRDIAKLLESGQEATARIRVEHIIREEKMMAAQEILELFSELIAVRLPIIEAQRDCPLDLKEAISSVCFAAPRCADLPELLEVQMSFASKYGKEFVAAATELMPDCGVNRQLIELLSIRPPSPEAKIKLLKDIAEDHGLEWDPTASETELLKSHEDLLNGSTLFESGSIVPLSKEKHEDSFHDESNRTLSERPSSEKSLQMLDFHDVPGESVRANLNDASAPETVPMTTSTSCEVNDESLLHATRSGHDISEKNAEIHAEHNEVMPENVADYQDEEANALVASKEGKQFVPFVVPPPDSPELFSAGLGAPQSSADSPGSFSAGLGAPQTSVDTPESFSAGLGAPQTSVDTPESFSVRLAAPQSSFSRIESDTTSVDLQDVLTAAQAAAETAEQAAAAARSAASLAQLRISGLAMKKSVAGAESGYDNPFHVDIQDHSAGSRNLSGDDCEIPSDYHEKVVTPVDTGIVRGYDSPFHVDTQDHSADGINVVGEDHKIPSDYHNKDDTPTDTGIVRVESGSPSNGSFRARKFDGDVPDSSPHDPLDGLTYQRSTSIEDESYFAYPNLFSLQNSLKSPPAQPFLENVRSSHEP